MLFILFSRKTVNKKSTAKFEVEIYMKRIKQTLTLVAVLTALFFLVTAAGQSVVSGSTLIALIPVGIVLVAVMLYVRLSEKKD